MWDGFICLRMGLWGGILWTATLLGCCRRWGICRSYEPLKEESAPLSHKTKYFCYGDVECIYNGIFKICSLFILLYFLNCLDYLASNKRITALIELEKLWKEAVVASSNTLSQNCLTGLKKIKKACFGIFRVCVKNWAHNPQIKKLEFQQLHSKFDSTGWF